MKIILAYYKVNLNFKLDFISVRYYLLDNFYRKFILNESDKLNTTGSKLLSDLSDVEVVRYDFLSLSR